VSADQLAAGADMAGTWSISAVGSAWWHTYISVYIQAATLTGFRRRLRGEMLQRALSLRRDSHDLLSMGLPHAQNQRA